MKKTVEYDADDEGAGSFKINVTRPSEYTDKEQSYNGDSETLATEKGNINYSEKSKFESDFSTSNYDDSDGSDW